MMKANTTQKQRISTDLLLQLLKEGASEDYQRKAQQDYSFTISRDLLLSYCKYYRNDEEQDLFSDRRSDLFRLWNAEREALSEFLSLQILSEDSLQESSSETKFSEYICNKLRATGAEDLAEIYASDPVEAADPVSLITLGSFLRAERSARAEAERIEKLLSLYPNISRKREFIDREISKLKAPIENTAEDLFYFDLKCSSTGDGDLIKLLSDRYSCILRSQHREADQTDAEDLFTFFYREKLRAALTDLRKQLSDGRSFTLRTNTQGETIKLPAELTGERAEQIFERARAAELLTGDLIFRAGLQRAERAYFLSLLFRELLASHIDEAVAWRSLAPVFSETAERMEQGFCLLNKQGAGRSRILKLIESCFSAS